MSAFSTLNIYFYEMQGYYVHLCVIITQYILLKLQSCNGLKTYACSWVFCLNT